MTRKLLHVQRVAMELLQKVYDDLISCESAQVSIHDGLADTHVDTWSLWRAISGKTEPVVIKEVNGLYLYGTQYYFYFISYFLIEFYHLDHLSAKRTFGTKIHPNQVQGMYLIHF